MDFEATNLYRSALWNEKTVYPKRESCFVLKSYGNDIFVEAFKNQTFN